MGHANALQAEKPLRSQPALKLVKTNDLNRDEWLTIRKQGIGGSDAASAMGLNPYKSQLELWMDKTGRDGNLPKTDPNDESSPMYWGNLLESVVASHYCKRTGYKVRRINAVLQHPTVPWMLANIDREVIGVPDVQILECKTAGMNGARLWKEGVPEYVQLQVMHQLAVTGKQTADVAVLIYPTNCVKALDLLPCLAGLLPKSLSWKVIFSATGMAWATTCRERIALAGCLDAQEHRKKHILTLELENDKKINSWTVPNHGMKSALTPVNTACVAI